MHLLTAFFSLSEEVVAEMKRFFQKTKEQLLDFIDNERELNSQIYDHLNSVIKLDMNGNLITYNQAFAKQYGYNEQDFNKPFLDVFIKYETWEQKQFFEKAILGKTQSFNAIGRCKNGKTVDINITLFPIKAKADIDVYVIVKNITDYKEQEKEMLLFQRKQDIFNELEHICDFYYDAINDRHHFSKQLPSIFGIDEGKEFSPSLNKLLQYVHRDDRNRVNNTMQDALKNKTGYQIEYRILRSDQTVHYVYEQAEILLDQKGHLDGLIGFIQDITNSKISNHVLANQVVDSDQFYRSLFESNLDLVFYADTHGVIAKTNSKFCEALGYSAEETVLSSIEQFLPSSEILIFREFFEGVLSGKKQHANIVFLCKTGKPLQIRMEGIPALSDGKVIGVFVISTDITETKRIEVELNQTELKFRSLVEQAFIGVYILEQDGKVSYGNPKFYQIVGSEPTKEINIWNYIHRDDQRSQKSIFDHLINGENGVDHSFRMIRKDGTLIDIEAHSKKVYLQENRPTVIGTLLDITERKKAEDLNKYLAYHDPLTDLPNGRLFQEKLEQELIVSKTLQQKLAVMMVDLDRFKYVNDTLGHPVGDKLLKQISVRLKKNLGDRGTLSRQGGDEFLFLLPNIVNTNQVVEYAKTLIESLEESFHIEKYELFITASIGISIFPNDGEDSETIIKHADSALYKAKDKGKNTYQIYTPSMDVESYKLFTLESDLRKALELNQLELYYQPKICTFTSQIIGAEALIRWSHPEWGVVSPGEFIPIAEETGIIFEIEKWIKETACIQIKAWQDAGLLAIPVSINLSAYRFLEKDLLVNLRETLATTKLDPKYLEVEITESSLLENEKVIFTILDEIRNMGIRISLDDFGTGYSSLSYLKRFKGRIDTLKIDQSFINDLSRTDIEETNFITKTIIELAKHLNMDVVAEGVETVEQLEILREYNCNTIQGYLFSKPVPAEEFAELLKKEKIEIPVVSSADENITIEDRRKFFRIHLDFPLSASMTLVRIHGKNVELGRTEVLIEDIGPGGLRFLSDIRLSVHRDILLEFETEIQGDRIKLYGTVVWMREVKLGIYQYGLEFIINEGERSILARILKGLALLFRKNPLVPNCRFVEMDRYQFFKEKKV
jgi:diguanylate cyclase (GGDEF)-like protein/PAS domain S-box-containing protein